MAAWPERVTEAGAGPAAFFGRLAERVASGEALAHPGLFVPYALALLLLLLAAVQLRAGRPSDTTWMAAPGRDAGPDGDQPGSRATR